MTKSLILAIEEIGENQNNKYITHNDAVEALEASGNDIFTNAAVGAGPVTLSETQATRYFVYKVSGGSAAFDITFPATINSNNAKRVFSVYNADTTYVATVKASTGTGPTIAVAPGETAHILQSYQDMILLGKSTAVGQPYDVGAFIPDKPEDGGEVFKFIAVRPCTFADDFAGSKGHVSANPTATANFDIKKNGSSIGTLSVSTGGVVTFSTTGTTTSLVAADRLTLVAPTPQDATLTDLAFTFLGTR